MMLKPKFRANQIYSWLYKKYVNEYSEMINIPDELKNELKKKMPINIAKIIKKEKSKDGSIKYLIQYADGATIESVLLLMSEEKTNEKNEILKTKQYTFCISTQVGCKIGCSFCLTARSGFKRNLNSGEIVTQVLILKKDNLIPHNKNVNIVYMGMGEPLDNYQNLLEAIKIISQKEGLSIGTRRQTISTSGISNRIVKLGNENLGVQLAISLHAVDDELRNELIPINKAYNIKSIINSVKQFPIDTRKKIMFEYLVIKDKNDDLVSAKKLSKLLNGIDAKVNLIYFNPFKESNYQRPSKKTMIEFQKYLLSKRIICTIRESKGLDISAACGQLKENQVK